MSLFPREATEDLNFEVGIWQHSEFLFEEIKEGSGEAKKPASLLGLQLEG